MFAFLLGVLTLTDAQTVNTHLGDIDGDGTATVLDLALINGHIRGTATLGAQAALLADLNGDGVVNQADSDELIKEILQTRDPQSLPLAKVRLTSPSAGESNVAVTRETILNFSMPLSLGVSLDTTRFYAEFGGRKILCRAELSSDRRKASLFYLEPLPANARLQVTFDGTGLTDLLGRTIDADGDGVAGGVFRLSFDTLSITPVAATAVVGRVFASEQVPASGAKMGKSRGVVYHGLPGVGQGEYMDLPLAGVTVTVDGAEETLRAVTDAQGNFTLSPAPAGDFFVHIDGRTCPTSHFPGGAYYPYVGKEWSALVGRTNNLAGGTGTIYLPLVPAGALQPVSQTQDTSITFESTTLANNPALAGTRVLVPANSLFADDGTRGGKVGIAAVPPDRLPSPLPPGLNLPLVITIQSDGATNFDRPVPVIFPNLPDPITGIKLAPGAKSALWSFNHDTGQWEIVGPMTVADDGNYVQTDVGVGVRQPGWHGTTPGSQVTKGGAGTPRNPCQEAQDNAGEARHDYFFGLLAAGAGKVGGKTGEWGERLYDVREHAQDAIDVAQGRKQPGEIIQKALLVGAGPFAGLVDLAEGETGLLNCLILNLAANAFPTQSLTDQVDYSNASDQFTAVIVSPEIIHYPPEETPKYNQFINVLLGMTDPLSPGGAQITDEEAGIIRETPRPSNLTPENVNQLIDRLRGYANNQLSNEQRALILSTGQNLINTIDHLQTKGWATNVDGFRAALQRQSLGTASGAANPLRARESMHYRLTELETGTVQRGVTSADGYLPNLILKAGTAYEVKYARLSTGQVASELFFAGDTGAALELPAADLSAANPLDSDGDGLADEVEVILGTDPANPDTDGDGVSDGAEVQQGTNPLDSLPVATGVIASAPTTAPALDICAVNNLAVTANGINGVTVFNVLSGLNPTRVAEIPTPGNALAVACANSVLAVADGSAGLTLIDLADPTGPRINQQVVVGGAVVAVATDGVTVYAGTDNGRVSAVDAASGAILQTLDTGSGRVSDLGIGRETLYVLKDPLQLLAVPLNADTLAVSSNVSLPGSIYSSRARLFVGPDVLYATDYQGYSVLNVADDPTHPVFLNKVNTTQLNWKQIVANGSGLGLAIVGVQSSDTEPLDLNLYSVGNDGKSNTFLTTLPTPGLAQAISVYNGLAYVADGASGLQVINYIAYDNQHQAPTISLSSNFSLSPAQAEEGKLMRLTASVTDDVQVRNVEFYVDGQLAVIDGNYPFEYRFTTPKRSAQKTSFTVRARAVDTGGNATWTPEIAVTLVPDATPPTVKTMFPSEGALTGSLRNLYATFSEPISPTTLTGASVVLTAAGADGILGTADDQPVTGGTLTYRDAHPAVFLGFAQDLTPGLYRLTVQAPVADLAGNPMATPAKASFRVFSFKDTDGDGVPDDVEVLLGLNPNNPDTDGNGIRDGDEDYDHDGLSNAGEILLGTDPRKPDSDGNGIKDGDEDHDHDGLTDGQEVRLGTDPFKADTDGDGWPDEAEVTAGSNPLDPASHPKLWVTSQPQLSMIVPSTTSSTTPFGIVLAKPPLGVVAPNTTVTTGTIVLGTTVSKPPTSVVLPSTVLDAGLIASGTVIAHPPATFVLPSTVNTSGVLSPNVIVAAPPLTMMLPANTGTGPVVSLTIAQPPVKVRVNTSTSAMTQQVRSAQPIDTRKRP